MWAVVIPVPSAMLWAAQAAAAASPHLQITHCYVQGQAEPSLGSLPAAFTPSGGVEDRYRYIHAPCLSFPTHKEGPRFVLCTFPALILLQFHVSSEVMTPSWGTHGAHTHCVCVVIPAQRHCLSPRGGFESSGRTPERTGEGRNVQRAEICGEVE